MIMYVFVIVLYTTETLLDLRKQTECNSINYEYIAYENLVVNPRMHKEVEWLDRLIKFSVSSKWFLLMLINRLGNLILLGVNYVVNC